MNLFIDRPALAQIRSEEISVYTDLVKALSKENPQNPVLVILAKTRPLSQSLLTSKADEISGLMPIATKSVISDFLNVGEKELHFDIQKLTSTLGNRVIALSEKDYIKLFNGSMKLKEAWKNFYRQFPKSHSLIKFSRVGIDKEGRQALVLLSISSGGQFGAGDLFLLSKENGRWKITQQVNIWIT
ncbi:hypothetical protein [Undibacterium flavidum]|uniref:Lumazine-binding protein n=1 Tax=Undibacterium flavidum TaxID=2762297 RepID=A0ABR6YG15_9BURK|nr:hypothetical protein [Undibacterium flavidum]MBC3875487.1 hypothetical protein [Undibacterium flavidum]